MIKRPTQVLAPADQEAVDWIHSLPVGEEIWVESKRPRNIRHHRKMFALIRFVRDATDHFTSERHLLLWIKLQIGHFEERVMPNGEICLDPKSISFESMSQDDFEPFYNAALEAIRRELFPTMTDYEIEAALQFYEGERI